MALLIDRDMVTIPVEMKTDMVEPGMLVCMVEGITRSCNISLTVDSYSSMANMCIQYTVKCEIFRILEVNDIKDVTDDEYTGIIAKYIEKSSREINSLMDMWLADKSKSACNKTKIAYCQLLANDYRILKEHKNIPAHLPSAVGSMIRNGAEAFRELSARRDMYANKPKTSKQKPEEKEDNKPIGLTLMEAK